MEYRKLTRYSIMSRGIKLDKDKRKDLEKKTLKNGVYARKVFMSTLSLRIFEDYLRTKAKTEVQKILAKFYSGKINPDLFITWNESISLWERKILDYVSKAKRFSVSSIVVKGTMDRHDKKVQDAFTHFQTGDFESAAKMFKNISKKYPDNKFYKLYNAICTYNSNDIKSAIPILKDILKRDNIISNQAEWYLGLCYIKLKDFEMARKIIQYIGVGSSRYSEAQKLLKLIETDKLHRV